MAFESGHKLEGIDISLQWLIFLAEGCSVGVNSRWSSLDSLPGLKWESSTMKWSDPKLIVRVSVRDIFVLCGEKSIQPCPVVTKQTDPLVIAFLCCSPRAVVAKIVVDQCIWSPAFTCIFYACMKTLEGQPEATISTIQEKFWPTLTAGYAVWIPAHIVNYSLVPLQQRVLYVNVVNVNH